MFPRQPSWRACNGSLPHLRGYPCALWMLMHTLTIVTLPVHTSVDTSTSVTNPTITSSRALLILTNFIKNFFTCEICRRHFMALTSDSSPIALSSDGDAILWLWQMHNLVSARLEGEGGGDPDYPKTLFPSHTRCPYCYHKVSQGQSHVLSHDQQLASDDVQPNFNNTDLTYEVDGNRQSQWVETTMNRAPRSVHGRRGLKGQGIDDHKHTFVWNRTAVLLYLWNFYHLDDHGNGTGRIQESKYGRSHQEHRHLLSSILQAAWPSMLRGDGEKAGSRMYDWRREQRLSSESPGSDLCVLSFIACMLFFGFISYWLYRRRRCKRFLRLPWDLGVSWEVLDVDTLCNIYLYVLCVYTASSQCDLLVYTHQSLLYTHQSYYLYNINVFL